MTAYKMLVIPVKDPSEGQTEDQVEQYYRSVKEGDLAAVRQTQYHHLAILVTTISGVSPRKGRVYLAEPATWGGAAFYMKSGKSCFYPGGQSNLIVPTDAVVAWAKQHPGDGVSLTYGHQVSDRRWEMSEQMVAPPKPRQPMPRGDRIVGSSCQQPFGLVHPDRSWHPTTRR